MVLGVGGNCTQEVVERLGLLREELKRDYAAILSVCPYYNKPQQEGLYRHFAAIAEASVVPVILYNVPGRTGVNMLPETVLRLAAAYPHQIIGVKEASGKQEQIETIIRGTRGSEFVVLSGDDGITQPLMALGAQGVISVAANAYTQPFSRMMHAMKEGRTDEALRLHYAMLRMNQLIFADGNPAGIKCLMSKMGLCENVLRLPLVCVNEKVEADIVEEWNKLRVES